MGLHIVQSTGLTKELTVLDTFRVMVKHLTRTELEKLNEACEGKDADEQAQIASVAYIAGWTGLTIPIVRRLGVMVPDDQPTDPKGGIPYDKDTARDLWRHAHANKFMLPVMACSREVLSAIEAEKELSKNGFGGWSQPSTTL